MSVAYDTSSISSAYITGSSTSFAWTHDAGTLSNGVILIWAWNFSDGTAPSSVTVGGSAATLLKADPSSNDLGVWVYGFLTSGGSLTVDINWGSGVWGYGMAQTFSGADQTLAHYTSSSTNGTTYALSLAVPSSGMVASGGGMWVNATGYYMHTSTSGVTQSISNVSSSASGYIQSVAAAYTASAGSITWASTGPNECAIVSIGIPAASGGSVSATASDTLSPSEGLARISTFPRALSDTASLTDTLGRSESHSRSVSDTPSPSDVLARSALMLSRTASDTVTPSETLARSLAGTRTATDTITPAEQLARTTNLTRTTTDAAASPSEVVTRAPQSLPRTVADTIGPGETLARATTGTRTLADSISPSEQIGRQSLWARALADAVSPIELLSRAGGLFGRLVSDVIEWVESLTGGSQPAEQQGICTVAITAPTLSLFAGASSIGIEADAPTVTITATG